uniref:Uncharacterized protein n=1 Tax=Chaetoceros debilis TaxID=122233 RepID=A0A7S3PW76_9STRA|mmetsp:Transcript_16084/g.24099  ORF Transcript_16084/g.24099 Transcript_16084/m.24099 type:complete len:122 (+) Transcript_16084:139-504(+)|eukprot:CAMPEP_0194099970 /NCGR_PEP_ID=MMETSP0150-20130528/1011_1 /TAXON_ID=122233 /ORGANISM="Chaetoceros debilis, Strain MM31A-1" /LENGTH=121 /DNA_ID=CAMNT_0038786271 /DNA_START=115 /DNA_END=480 /DNA_ORIENTATION=+
MLRSMSKPVASLVARNPLAALAPSSQAKTQALVQQQHVRHMSKYMSKAGAKRLPLSTKHVRKGYYKGKGHNREGSFVGRAGRFVVQKDKLLELMVPDLTGFKLKPYIGNNVPKWAPEDTRA